MVQCPTKRLTRISIGGTFTDEGRCEKLFSEQSIRLPCGRFSVPLPFRAPPSADTFVGSRELAVRRFDALERKLATSPQLKSLYVQFMSEYISLSHNMSVSTSPGRYLIPHHAVYRPAIDEKKYALYSMLPRKVVADRH